MSGSFFVVVVGFSMTGTASTVSMFTGEIDGFADSGGTVPMAGPSGLVETVVVVWLTGIVEAVVAEGRRGVEVLGPDRFLV